MQKLMADIIRFHRKRSGLTQLELAEMAGVGKNLIYELENGKQSVRLNNLLKVLQVLNINLEFQSPLRDAFLKEQSDAQS
jgi:y4mF family transcriptional regulator